MESEAGALRPLLGEAVAYAYQSGRSDVGPGRAAQVLAKRIVDVTLAALLIFALLPVLLVVGLVVKLTSPGPILYKQQRVGRSGRPFCFYKFRTMVDGCTPDIHRTYAGALIRGEAVPVNGTFKLANDPRVTRVGAFLRRYSLDEFPQLINVLLGQMSLVGPRPPLPYEVEQYGAQEWRRLTVTPGLTGLWQVSGRSMLTFREMLQLDLHYIEQWSLWLDLKILLRTPLVVVLGEGAR